MMDWLADLYVNTLNLIQYMHDKYYYEAAEMALIDTDVKRTFATGIAGFSHVVDSLSAIKYAKVKTVRDETGIVVDYEIEGDFPKYGNDDAMRDEYLNVNANVHRGVHYLSQQATDPSEAVHNDDRYGQRYPNGRAMYPYPCDEYLLPRS